MINIISSIRTYLYIVPNNTLVSNIMERIKNLFFKFWYWYISAIDKNADVTFMNYGYSNGCRIELDKSDEKNRYSAQLYNFVAKDIDTRGKDILEVGCGRGGGLSYINRQFSPNTATGLDMNKSAIKFCKEYYSNQKIHFFQGNAQNLSFQDNSFDIVINVESSHRYPKMDKFTREAHRVLKQGGLFLFTDFRPKKELDKLTSLLNNSKFRTLKYELITTNILEALKLSSTAREDLIRKLIPKYLQGIGKTFAATEGTPTYNKFMKREFEYVFYVLRKV